MAYLVDAETAEHHRELSAGMRQADVDLACEQAGGGLLDLAAAGRLPEWIDPIEVAQRIAARYEALWSELTDVEVICTDERAPAGTAHPASQRPRVRRRRAGRRAPRRRRSTRMRMWPALVEEGHHARELQRMTGLDVQENQARHLLNDIAAYRRVPGAHDRSTICPSAVIAARWIAEIYEPLLRAVPAELAGKRERTGAVSRAARTSLRDVGTGGREVTNREALASFVEEVLPTRRDERLFVDVTPSDRVPGAATDDGSDQLD